jgi:hypothetical protein
LSMVVVLLCPFSISRCCRASPGPASRLVGRGGLSSSIFLPASMIFLFSTPLSTSSLTLALFLERGRRELARHKLKETARGRAYARLRHHTSQQNRNHPGTALGHETGGDARVLSLNGIPWKSCPSSDVPCWRLSGNGVHLAREQMFPLLMERAQSVIRSSNGRCVDQLSIHQQIQYCR